MILQRMTKLEKSLFEVCFFNFKLTVIDDRYMRRRARSSGRGLDMLSKRQNESENLARPLLFHAGG